MFIHLSGHIPFGAIPGYVLTNPSGYAWYQFLYDGCVNGILGVVRLCIGYPEGIA